MRSAKLYSTRLAVAVILLAVAASPVAADWTASGRLLYEDREWTSDGFTGVITDNPVRFADVEVIDPTKRGKKGILATGSTDENGYFLLNVIDSSTRTVYIRALTTSTQTSDLNVRVITHGGATYALSSDTYTGHNPGTDIDVGTLVATVGGGGEAFNMFDLLVYGADYIKHVDGARPGKRDLVTIKWEIDGGVTGAAYTSGRTITMRDYAAYDDTVVLHEWSHYVMNEYSSSSNPGGIHYLSDCDEDPRLAFDEGRASGFGCSVRRHFGFPSANVYLRTSGATGPGGVQNWYDLETEVQYPCNGGTSEVAISRSVWDISDSESTTDTTPGVEDAHDLLALPDGEIWEVYRGNLSWPITLESFWNGWFSAGNGYLSEMEAIFGFLSIEYLPDGHEPNDTVSEATLILSNDAPLHLTYFSDPNGDGQGQPDLDLFRIDAIAGVPYTIETLNLLSDADTQLELLDSDGTTVLITNDDRSGGDPSSLINWTAPRTDTFYIRSEQQSSVSVFGSYDLSVTNP